MKIFTGAFWSPRVKRMVLDDEAIAVGIVRYPTRTPDKWGYSITANLKSLAPDHLIFKINEYDAFRVPFLEMLERTWPVAKAELEWLGLNYPDKALILLCFDRVDRPSDWCHRQIVAEFLQLHGFSVAELDG